VRRHVTASELAECCVCEKRVVLDRQRGKQRTARSTQQMRAGEVVHQALHRDALRQQAADGRCFVATALWGSGDPRTWALRRWRDRWLMKRWWGSAAVRLYCATSPWLVRLMSKAPRCRSLVDACLSRVAGRLPGGRGE